MATIKIKGKGSQLQPTTRINSIIEPSTMSAALIALNRGDWSQIGPIIDMMLGTSRIGAVIDTRIRSLQGLRTDIRHESENVKLALEEDLYKLIPEGLLLDLRRYGMMAGAVVVEIVWQQDPVTKRYLPRMVPWHPANQKYDRVTKTWSVKTEKDELKIKIGEEGGYQWLVYKPMGEEYPWLGALAGRLSTEFLMLSYSISDWGSYSEVHGSPLRVAIGGETPEIRQGMASTLGNLGADTAIAIPEDYQLMLLEAVGNTWHTFQAMVSEANTSIAIAVLGQNLTTEVQAGSQAAAVTQNHTRQDILRSDAEYDATWLNSNLIKLWTIANFGEQTTAPWVTFDATPLGERVAYADFATKVAEAYTALQAVEGVDLEAFLEGSGIPLIKNRRL